jgi:subtilisin-like proprotein convertase family protein
MQNSSNAETRRGLLLSLFVLGLLAALTIVPYQFRSQAGANDEKFGAAFPQDNSNRKNYEFYDIRHYKNDLKIEALAEFRQSAKISAAEIADVKDDFVRGELALKERVPSLKIHYNKELENPEIITPDVLQGKAVLASATGESRSEMLRRFAKNYDNLIGASDTQIDSLKTAADYVNPNGELAFARLEQFIGDVPVFRGEIRAGFNKRGEMFRVINNLAPALNETSLSKDFGDPAEAVRRAAGYLNLESNKSLAAEPDEKSSTDLKVAFGTGDWATTAEKMYFPIEAGVARAAWRVLIWEPIPVYVIVDAETGTMLFRETIVDNQTQTATYNVYANTTNMLKTMANPAPLAVNPTSPATGTQGALQPRSNITLVGNEAPYNFNNNGWITDGNNSTDGNAVEAGIDRDEVDGVDAPVTGASRVFNFDYMPGAGANFGAGDSPLTQAYQNGAATNLFYISNRFHDETYLLGFTEQARNFQANNFGRGGVQGDRISAQAQDDTVGGTSCTERPCANNANFATPDDGGRGRMQMYIWNLMTPNRDGSLDGDIVVHELAHGVFRRLHNGAGGTQGSQLSEGNSDFFAHAMLSHDTDPIDGIYMTGGYVTLNARSGAPFSRVGNYYYGIRRFPKAVISFTGGPNNRPHNPLTYADIDPAQMDLTNGAYAPAFTGFSDSPHDGGEIWSSMLWEVRARLIARLGTAAGNRKALQLVMDGMKLAPTNPTMLLERDAILAAAQATSQLDVADVWAGFAARGMGFSAANNTGSTVIEAFDLPNAIVSNPFTVSDAPGDNDGIFEPGESVLLNVPVTNLTGESVSNVTATVAGGGSANYGNLANGQTVVRQIAFTIPSGADCGIMQQVKITVSSSKGVGTPVAKTFRLGSSIPTAPITFANSTLTNLPNGQPTASFGPSSPYPSSIAVSGLTGNKTIKVEITGITHTYPGDLDFLLVGPGGQKFVMLSDSGFNGDVNNLTFTLSDSAAVPPSTTQWVAGNFKPTDVASDTGDNFPDVTAPYATPNPNGSATFTSVFGTNANGLNGTWNLYIVDDTSGDVGNMAGWKITFEGADYACSYMPPRNIKSRADYDGDGRTDLSVFRPASGSWFLNRSRDGFTAVNFGLSGDLLAPGDYDGDGKTDVAVFRSGSWFVLKSSDNSFSAVGFGFASDVLVAGDYDGDGRTDPAVYRPSNNTWYALNSSGGVTGVAFGAAGDVPVSGDFDGDGKSDFTVFRNGQWITQTSSGAVRFTDWGLPTDKPVAADYDGDNKDDIAVYRPETGVWYVLNSSNNQMFAIAFGAAGDVATPGDYDGDGRDDVAVYRAGTWYLMGTTSGFAASQFGVASDVPAPSSYLPKQ